MNAFRFHHFLFRGSQPSRIIAASSSLAAQIRHIRTACSANNRTLPEGLNLEPMPKHVGFIMDGNSRWAERRNPPRFAGHTASIKSLAKVIQLVARWQIPLVSFFPFSSENWSQSKTEIDFLMDLFEVFFNQITDTLMRENVRLLVIGEKTSFRDSLQNLMARVENETKRNCGTKGTLVASYSGRAEITEACRFLPKMVGNGQLKSENITEELLSENLQTILALRMAGEIGGCDADLIIRTSGEQRLSNFLLWYSTYGELHFERCLRPDFGESELANALVSFQRPRRRFGERSQL